MTTCSEYAAMKSQAEANQLIAEAELNVASAERTVAEASMALAMSELGTANINLATKQAVYDNYTSQIQFITMMMQMQGC
jgi:hypothetical protein